MFDITLGSHSTNATANSEEFTETVTFSVTQNGAAGTNTFVGGSGRTEQTHASTTLTGTSNGEAVALDLKDRSLFSDMRTYFDAHEGGTFNCSKMVRQPLHIQRQRMMVTHLMAKVARWQEASRSLAQC